jgi:hypothetical protein
MADEPIRWKKTGGGTFYFHKRIIKPGQVFLARPSEIHAGLRNTIVPLDSIPVPPPPPQVAATPVKYEVTPRGKSNIWFDVVDPQGKIVNEKALKKEVAEKLAKDLS